MEIEEMKALWSEMSDQLEQQKKLNKELIMKMTKERYKNKFKTLFTYELVGAVVCFVVAVQIILNFDHLDTWYLALCGIFTLLFLLVMPILVLRQIQSIKNVDLRKNNYKETLIAYTKAKKRLLLIQQVGIFASFFLMFAVAAVFSKLFSGKDFFMVDRGGWSYAAFIVAMLFVAFVSKWGYGHYKRITHTAGEILKELE